MPTPAEWSAFFGASALVALVFAWFQVRQVDQSNKALIRSNDLARLVNIEAVRPRVQVAFSPQRVTGKQRGGRTEGNLYVAVRNIGTSPARAVKLTVDRPFTSRVEFFKPDMMPAHFAEMNSAFNGDIHFQTMNPGVTYIWFLGQVPGMFDLHDGLPRRWEVTAEYLGSVSQDAFVDKFVLDLDIEKLIEFPVDPLVRIGRDLEVVGDVLTEMRRQSAGPIDLSDETLAAMRPRRRSPWRPKHHVRHLPGHRH